MDTPKGECVGRVMTQASPQLGSWFKIQGVLLMSMCSCRKGWIENVWCLAELVNSFT